VETRLRACTFWEVTGRQGLMKSISAITYFWVVRLVDNVTLQSAAGHCE